MPRHLIGAVANGLLTAGLAYCSLGVVSWAAQAYALHRKIAAEREALPTLMVDEDLLVTKKRVFGQDRVLLAQDVAFWNFLRDKSSTHTISIRQKGIVPTGVLKQLCLNMHLPVSTRPSSKAPCCNHIALQHEREGLGLHGLVRKALSPLHTTKLPGTTIYLRSRAEVRYLPAYYGRLIDDQSNRCIALVDEIAELEFISAEATDSEYPFYTQGALRLAVSQRLLREPVISALQDRL